MNAAWGIAVLGVAAAAVFAALWRIAEARRALEAAGRLSGQADELRLRETFEALASRALKENAGAVHRDAEGVVGPLKEALDRLDSQVRALEAKRAEAMGEVAGQLRDVRATHAELSRTTATLAAALTSSGTKGAWGELTLRRLVELAGMVRHVDFTEQEAGETGRPDLLVRLADGGWLPVDAKATLKAFRAAVEARDEGARAAALAEHLKALKGRIVELGRREYWKQFDPAPEFVVMFVPVEASLGAAYELDGDLLEFALGHKVLLATPVTLLGLLKAVAHGWTQRAAAENIREIQAACVALIDRLTPFLGHLVEVGARLEGAVKAYNAGVGSWERQVAPAAERVRSLGVGAESPPPPRRVEAPLRRLESPPPPPPGQA